MKTPYELVMEKYTFPPEIESRDYQINTVNYLAPLSRAGYYLGGGTGKTFISTVSALYKMEHQGVDVTWAVMPPILGVQWYRWLSRINPTPRVLYYSGTPTERRRMNLDGYDFIISSMDIFKRDYERIAKDLRGRKAAIIVDEAQSMKNVATQNYKTVRDFVNVEGADFMPLTATPLSTPMDGYAFVKMIAPPIYRNLTQFTDVHVASRDFFGQPLTWKNLDALARNLNYNSVRLQRREVKRDIPLPVFDPIYYPLAPEHYKIYRDLVENQLLELPDGGKIDATQVNTLYHKMQQIVCNFAYFSGNPENEAAGFELIDQMLEELGDKKLVVVANYKLTNRKLVERFSQVNAVAAFGDISPKQQGLNKDRFIDDPGCRLFAIQPSSAGFGLDGLQHVCSDMFFLEMPRVPRDFHQTVWRIDRDGQKDVVRVRIGVAQGTLQVKMLGDMLAKDELIGRVQPNLFNLRREMFGELDRILK